ncbi:MAG: glycosyltransferase family 9 protein [Bacteroidetes bacterium]|jgi:ADP-heptose:LPS heptosyltransferase|nr:glycosyltransferase family 9 protein [Bacteroidota bacterium]
MSQQVVRILIIRFSSIGDIVLTAPVVAALRAAVDGPCELHYLTKKAYAPVVEGMGAAIDRVHTIDRSTREVTVELDALAFDFIIDLHNNLRSRRVKNALKVLAFTVDKWNTAKWMLVRGWRKEPVPHIVTRYAETLAAFGAEEAPTWPPIWECNSEQRSGLCIAIGATHGGKRMPQTLLNDVIAAFPNQSITLIGGAAETTEAETIARDHGQIINCVNQLSLKESAQTVGRSRAVLSGDTGMMHIAAAMKTPVVAVWGCTRPALGMFAWLPAEGSVNIEPKGRGQRPCSKLGDRCRHGGHRSGDWCTHHVPSEQVVAALRAVLD